MNRDATETAAGEVRGVVDRWVRAFYDRSAADAMSIHAPAMVSFDIVPPLRYVGQEAYRGAWEAAFDLFASPIEIEVRDVDITTGHDVAFLHSLVHFSGELRSGGRHDYWFRWTAGLTRTDGRWSITHDHTSLPTDFSSGESVMNLRP